MGAPDQRTAELAEIAKHTAPFDRVEILGRLRVVERGEKTMLERELLAVLAERDAQIAELQAALRDAADAIHDLLWVIGKKPKREVGLPDPTFLSLSRGQRSEKSAREVLAATEENP